MTDTAPRFDPQTGRPVDLDNVAETVLRNVAPTVAPALSFRSRSAEERAADETIVVFELDDVAYTMPKRPRPNIALNYLHLGRTAGTEEAIAYLLEESLGVEGFAALRGHEDLEPADFAAVVKIITKHVLGGLEAGK